MASITQQTWVWASSRRWWKTGKPGVLQSMVLQKVRHNWVTEQASKGTQKATRWRGSGTQRLSEVPEAGTFKTPENLVLPFYERGGGEPSRRPSGHSGKFGLHLNVRRMHWSGLGNSVKGQVGSKRGKVPYPLPKWVNHTETKTSSLPICLWKSFELIKTKWGLPRWC